MKSRVSVFLIAMCVGAFVSTAVSCGPAPAKCSVKTCASGCCDASGTCQSGSVQNACGSSGLACSVCGLGTVCSLGQCTSSGNGGGTASNGGGTASNGGGTASNGGGTASNGGGTASNGGGTASNGGGTASNGGGTSSSGGGTASNGGGTSSSGGGTASNGGGTASNGGGTASNGGGTSSSGGGTASSGGGSSSSGGGTASNGGGTSSNGGGTASNCLSISAIPTALGIAGDYGDGTTQSHFRAISVSPTTSGSSYDGVISEVWFSLGSSLNFPVSNTLSSTTYTACADCLIFVQGCDAQFQNCSKEYLAQSGSIQWTSGTPNELAGQFAGSGTNLRFTEWDFANDVSGGTGCVEIGSLDFNVSWPADAGP